MQKMSFFLLLLIIFSFYTASSNAATKNTTICTESHCQQIEPLVANDLLNNKVVVYQTSDQEEWMVKRTQSFTYHTQNQWQHIIFLENNISETYPIIGFGGSFTDSSAVLYYHLKPKLQQSLIDAYFSNQGIEYSLGRVPMGSTDFSCRKISNEKVNAPSLTDCSSLASLYTYADYVSLNLNNFTLQAEDVDYKIPMIHAANSVLFKNHHTHLKLFASPWSAPAWMKTNGSMIHGSLLPAYQALWAKYYVRFFNAYKTEGITFWSVTVQNEPIASKIHELWQRWQTMFFTQDQEAEFVKNYLGPTLKEFEKSYGSEIKIIMHDDQIDKMAQRSLMLQDPQVAQYIAGAGLHWYQNYACVYHHLDKAYQLLNQDKPRFILGTEACAGYLPFNRGPDLGSWHRGEAYAHDIINDLNHHVSGWTDWNLLLDLKGGPNWAKNYVDAPILVDVNQQFFYKQPMYYYLGHFSKFIRPGAQKINHRSEGPAPLETVVYKVPAQQNLPATIVIVVLNRDITGRDYYLEDQSIMITERYLNMHIPAHAIQTIIYHSQIA